MQFQGYRRPDGRVGVRNHVVVMPGCLCSTIAARKICQAVEGVTYLENPNGCAQNSRDTAITLEIISGLIANGNVYGVLIVGNGCETIQEDRYRAEIGAKTNKPVEYISIQGEGGLKKTVEKGVALITAMKAQADQCKREPCDLSELTLGLECGGSDPTSGLSSNVVLGWVSDYLVDAGGTAILAETPEAIGAENILRDRGATPEVGQRIYDMIMHCEKQHLDDGEDVRNCNPSPGNKAGGITTLEEKSIGCIHKSGTRPFVGAYEYGQLVDQKGLVFMDGTAFDVASTVSLIAGGAQVVVFTTGRGNPVGAPTAPVIKVTGNHETYEWLNDILDMDTSASISGEKTVEELGREMLDLVVRVCNGEPVKAELNGCNEMCIDQLSGYC